MTVPSELGRRVGLVGGGLVVALAAVIGLVRGPADALGVLVGGSVTLVNFGGLTWAAGRALAAPADRPAALWIGASGLRLGLVGTLTGLLIALTDIGVAGLALSLLLVPVAVVLVGLQSARAV